MEYTLLFDIHYTFYILLYQQQTSLRSHKNQQVNTFPIELVHKIHYIAFCQKDIRIKKISDDIIENTKLFGHLI